MHGTKTGEHVVWEAVMDRKTTRKKHPPKLGAGLNFCIFTLGSRNHQKKKNHSHACLFFFTVVGTIVRAASTSLGC